MILALNSSVQAEYKPFGDDPGRPGWLAGAAITPRRCACPIARVWMNALELMVDIRGGGSTVAVL
jgi:hypothetical protein